MNVLAQESTLRIPDIDWFALAPMMFLFGAALLIVLLRSTMRRSTVMFDLSLLLATIGLVGAGIFTVVNWTTVRDDGPYQAIAGMLAVDGFAVFVQGVVLAATAVALLVSVGYLRAGAADADPDAADERRGRGEAPEYVALMLMSATGMLAMAGANDLISVFVALEVLSMALYVLAAFDRQRSTSQEAGLKYFILGSFSSAVFLYGIALVYGATGTTSITGIAEFLAGTSLTSTGTLLAGIMLLLVGLAFKIAAVPFHMWTPDVYQGSPTPVTAFMAGATKAAAFAAILRVLLSAFDLYRLDWQPVVWVLAAITMVWGAVAAVVQTDVKRILAYSSISHAGFVLIGVEAASERGVAAALFYLLAYVFLVAGSFAVVYQVGRRRDDDHRLDDYRGLAFREPVLAGVLTVLLLGQAGVPLTSGFVAKLGVFQAAVDADQWPLVLVAMIATVVAAFAYLRIVVTMFVGGAEPAAADEPSSAPVPGPRTRLALSTGSALFVATALTLFLGILPTAFLDLARDATLLIGAR